MKQIYYTSCEPGKSLTGASGFQVRAASEGLGRDRMRALLRYAGYALPPHLLPSEATPRTSPVRLALLEAPEGGRLLCHTVYVGPDPVTRRPGNFFSHLVVDVPPMLTAAEAIRTWGSSFWRHEDGMEGSTLAEVAAPLPPGNLGDAELAAFLREERSREMFRFVLAAFLASRPIGRIFLAAPSDEIALCVYGLVRAVPSSLLGGFTFSTYESEPLGCRARLVGTWGAESPELDMPAACYVGRAVGYNAYTGRRSDAVAPGHYVDFAVEALATGNRTALNVFFDTCRELGVAQADLLEVAFRIYRGIDLSSDDFRRALDHPQVATALIDSPVGCRQLLALAGDDPASAKAVLPRALSILKADACRLDGLRRAAEQSALEAIERGDLERVQNVMEGVVPIVAGDATTSARLEILDQVASPASLSWEMRAYLLAQVVSSQPKVPDSRWWSRWLVAPEEELAAFCRLNVPVKHKAAACTVFLKKNGITPWIVTPLVEHPGLTVPVLIQLSEDPESAPLGETLFDAVLRETRRDELLDELMDERDQLPSALLGRCLAAAAKNDTRNTHRLAAEHGSLLLQTLSWNEGLDAIIGHLVASPIEDLISEPKVLEILRSVSKDTTVTEPIRGQAASVLQFKRFLERPVLSGPALAQVSALLKQRPGTGELLAERLFGSVWAALLAQAGSPEVCGALEAALAYLGMRFPGGPAALYGRLLDDCQRERRFWRERYLLHAFLAVGLGVVRSSELAGQLMPVAEVARDLAEQIARRSKRRVFAAIEDQTCSWPPEARLRWNLFAKYVRPKSVWARLLRSQKADGHPVSRFPKPGSRQHGSTAQW